MNKQETNNRRLTFNLNGEGVDPLVRYGKFYSNKPRKCDDPYANFEQIRTLTTPTKSFTYNDALRLKGVTI